jgi:hypothetical protein
MPDTQSDRRSPPTDRLPDKPPPWKGAFAGSSYERANSRHVGLLDSRRGSIGLSGNALPLQECNKRVERPSNQCHASAAGSSLKIAVRSWMHTSGRRSRVKRDTCVACGDPSPNLGRNLFPCGLFLRCTKSAGSMAQRDNRHSIRCVAQRALSGAATHLAGARPSKCIIIIISHSFQRQTRGPSCPFHILREEETEYHGF